MKGIIDGVTYDTDTATDLAYKEYAGEWNNFKCPVRGWLYQTRDGAFFIEEVIMTCPKANTSHDSAEGEFHEYDVDAGETDRDKIYGIKNRIVKCSEDAARTFINEMREQKKSAHIMHDPFEDETPGPLEKYPPRV
jgi:hypothetical protein